MFKDGRTNVHDEEWSGRSAICSEWWSRSKCWPKNFRKTALHNFGTFVRISTNFKHYSLQIITVRLGYHNFDAIWVPKVPTSAHKTQRIASALTFFRAIPRRWWWILNHIVTDDVTWVSSQNRGCTHIHQTNRKSLNKRCLSARKLMATVFCDRKGVLMVEFTQQGTTITSEVCCVRNTKKLCGAIQNKMLGMLTSGVVLLHDNARPHTVARTRALLEHFNWELFDRPPYSPDLAPTIACLPTWRTD
jgi:hypothetical protein